MTLGGRNGIHIQITVSISIKFRVQNTYLLPPQAQVNIPLKLSTDGAAKFLPLILLPLEQHFYDAIIYSDEFDLVQIEMAHRKALGKSYRGMNCFSSKIVCGDCGLFIGSKVWHSVINYCVIQLKMKYFWGYHFDENTASGKVMKNAGMIFAKKDCKYNKFFDKDMIINIHKKT